ncbi:MAG: uncharacterized protein JWM74_5879 [Myxococcaceae bacterium]|jgi:hypothetical protein|nr:uncharacterized protein [Myxococcaceae bacterium]
MAAFTARYRSARSCLGFIALSLAVATSTGEASGAEKKVSVGEVSTNIVRTDVDLSALLRTTIESELAGVDLSRVSRKDASILSVSLIRMDTEPTAHGASTTCVISATLRTKKGGAVFAILEGRARADNGASTQKSAEAHAIQGAVRGAIVRLPEALR